MLLSQHVVVNEWVAQRLLSFGLYPILSIQKTFPNALFVRNTGKNSINKDSLNENQFIKFLKKRWFFYALKIPALPPDVHAEAAAKVIHWVAEFRIFAVFVSSEVTDIQEDIMPELVTHVHSDDRNIRRDALPDFIAVFLKTTAVWE